MLHCVGQSAHHGNHRSGKRGDGSVRLYRPNRGEAKGGKSFTAKRKTFDRRQAANAWIVARETELQAAWRTRADKEVTRRSPQSSTVISRIEERGYRPHESSGAQGASRTSHLRHAMQRNHQTELV